VFDAAFCKDFLANLLSDLAVGAVLGTLLAWWIGRRLSESEQAQERRQAERKETEKAKRYAELIKTEVNDLVGRIPEWTELIQDRRPPLDLLGTTYWDILQPSGELPKLMSPDLLGHLVRFYSALAIFRRLVETVVDDSKNDHRPDDDGQATMRVSLRELSAFAPPLLDELDKEVERLQGEL
jgi:hypothetical protein